MNYTYCSSLQDTTMQHSPIIYKAFITKSVIVKNLLLQNVQLCNYMYIAMKTVVLQFGAILCHQLYHILFNMANLYL